MLQSKKSQTFTADEAIAIYEESMSYYMPATYEEDAAKATEAAQEAIVPYYEAA